MMPIRTLIAILLAAPFGIFLAHAVTYRSARGAGRNPSAHSSAFMAIMLWFAATLAVCGVVVFRADGSALSKICAIVYVAVTYVALAILYLDAVNIAETSLHMHVLLEVMWTDRPSLAGLVERYSAERMIATRLERLVSLGQIRAADDRYYLANTSTLRLNRVIDWWRTVLGLPTSPEQVHAS
jgi:hypothetical protein